MDFLEEKNYNNRLKISLKRDSLIVYRYSKKDRSTTSAVLRGVVMDKTYTGVYTRTSDQAQGAFVFMRDQERLVKQEPVPDLSVSSSGGNSVSLADHKSKYLLLDFWATYCKTCIPKRIELDSVFSKFADQLDILSISLDKDPATVENFRKEKFPMKWKNICVSGNFDAPVCKLSGIDKIGTPGLFLISPDGLLLAKTDELVGRGIDALLTEYKKNNLLL